MEPLRWDAAIIGGGAAGLSAALMLGRARRRTIVLDAGRPRNRFAAQMHGVLGHEGADPRELLARGRAEVAEYGVAFIEGTVDLVEETSDGVAIALAGGESILARALVVASGLTDHLPEIPGLAERWGTSVLHCPYCHGWEFRDHRLGVLAASPIALHQVELVRQWSGGVVLFAAGLGELAPATERRLRARGIEIVSSPVVEVLGEGDRMTGVRLADGGTVRVDAIYTSGVLQPNDDFLAGLRLARAETPMGDFLAVDAMGRTSGERIWAAGNVTNPGANVPVSIAAGALVGGAVNMALVTADFDAAEREGGDAAPEAAPAEYWERRYADAEQVWSGRVNRVLADVAAGLEPGSALDLGCGEGADVLWLAEQGWSATGIDISSTAIRRADEAARAANQPRARFLAGDLAELDAGERYDLVTASFLHSPVELPRAEILRRAAERVAPGGHLLITSHADYPPWADARHGHTHRFLRPAEEIEALDLDAESWEIVLAEIRARETVGPDGRPAALDDAVVLLRRR